LSGLSAAEPDGRISGIRPIGGWFYLKEDCLNRSCDVSKGCDNGYNARPPMDSYAAWSGL